MSEPPLLHALRSVPGFAATATPTKVVFEGEGSVVTWAVTPAALARYVATLRRGSRGVWAHGRVSGESILSGLLEEALRSFPGGRGEMRLGPAGPAVDALPDD